jgi:hypothetical protein
MRVLDKYASAVVLNGAASDPKDWGVVAMRHDPKRG